MSRSYSSSFIPGMRKGTELTVLALLVGLFMALQLVLPAVALAFPTRLAASGPPSDIAFAKAEVSVVRLVVSYTTPAPSSGTPTAKATSSSIQCTGLGILVGSWQVAGSYVNWVLTDGALVSKIVPACASSASNTTGTLVGIDVYRNNAYTGASNPPGTQPLGSLQCPTDPNLCESKFSNAASLPGGAKLFSFASSVPQPFVDVATQDVQPHLAIKLTDTGQRVPAPLVSASVTIQDFLDPMPVSVPPGMLTTPGPTERGTPIVNAAGQVVSIQLGANANLLPVAAAKAILEQQPGTLHSNPLQTAWNKGIDDLYQRPANNAAAATAFRAVTQANPAFGAGTTFMGFAVANGKGGNQGTPPVQPQSSSSYTLPIPKLWLWLGAGVIVLLVVLVLGIMVLRRSRAHRRELAQFAEDAKEADRIAAIGMPSEAMAKGPDLSRPRGGGGSPADNPAAPPQGAINRAPTQKKDAQPPISQPLTPKPLPIQQAPAAVVKEPGVTASTQTASDLRCPNCKRFVRADATYCPNCRHQLSSLTSHLQSQAIVAPPSASHGSGPSAETPVPQSQAALVEVPPGNPAIEARLRRLWSQPG